MAYTGEAIRSIGAALRAERQRRHISLDAVARGTLVRQDFLELIDADRLEELPGGAYAKGFIRSYVTYLGLDPEPFLTAYDERCGPPQPELSPLVQRGVRVPPPVHRRGWKIAVGSAAVIVVLLALLGVFRSGDEPAEIPNASATAARVRDTTAPSTLAAVVRVEVISDESWVEAQVDGQQVFGAVLKRGEYETFKGNDQIGLYITRANAVRITANGHILGTPEAGSYRGVFTRDTKEFPPNLFGVPDVTTEPSTEPSSVPE